LLIVEGILDHSQDVIRAQNLVFLAVELISVPPYLLIDAVAFLDFERIFSSSLVLPVPSAITMLPSAFPCGIGDNDPAFLVLLFDGFHEDAVAERFNV